MNTSSEIGDARQLRDALVALRTQILQTTGTRLSRFARDFPEDPPPGAINLAHYLSLRSVDLRPLQAGLARMGLSSLGRSESHVMAGLDQVIRVLEIITERRHAGPFLPDTNFDAGARRLAENALSLFGPPPGGRDVRIMVTLPTEAARDPDLVRRLVDSGMDCARINCAHDDSEAWGRMVRHVREASRESGRPCRIQMDLAGHKLRTGPLVDAQPVLHLRPPRDALGHVLAPARVELIPEHGVSTPASPAAPRLMLQDEALFHMAPGDCLRFRDTRDKQRSLLVTTATVSGWLAECNASSYISPETRFSLERLQADGDRVAIMHGVSAVGFEPRPVEIHLMRGDRLLLTRNCAPGEPASLDREGRVMREARIGCTTPEILDRLGPGQAVCIDDGKLGGVVESVDAEGAHLRITHACPRGVRLRADKGLNFPGADLQLPPLTAKDLDDLNFVVAHADLVGYSFVQTRDDMAALIEALAARNAPRLGIVAKIETARAVSHLPEIILGTIGRHPLGVMIARGDLAVELGGERMAEIQEEILWLCEAAHVPVIWATQVLETLARKGVVSRPEMTDAAMSGRAECVMLNKGPFILDAVHTLNGILRRMQEHQRKKTARLRALRLAGIGET